MNKTLHCTIFLAILLLLVCALTWLFLPKNNTYEDGIHDFLREGYLSEPENSLEVVFLGDSIPFSGICPPVIWQEQGIPSFVCAGKAKALPYTVSYLKSFLRRQTPKLVVLETNVLYHELTDRKRFDAAMEEYFPLYIYHDNWKMCNPKRMLQPFHFEADTWEKGHQMRKHSLPYSGGAYMLPSSDEEPVPEISIPYFQQLLSLCQQHNATLMLLSIPSATNMSTPRHNALERFAASYGLEYLDLNQCPQIDIDWSHDTLDRGDHLNWWGAEKASKFLAAYLMDTGLFSDRREDPSYQKWNETSDSFMNLVAESWGYTEENVHLFK